MEVDQEIRDLPDLTDCIKTQQSAVQAVSNECSGGDHADHNGSDKQLGNGAKNAANHGSTPGRHPLGGTAAFPHFAQVGTTPGPGSATEHGSEECADDRNQSTQQHGPQEADGKRANKRECNGSPTDTP